MGSIASSIYTVQFDIVHGCQLRCVGCPNSTLLPKVGRIPVVDFDRALRNIDVRKIHTFRLFNFGEPLLHKELAAIVECIPRQRWKASIVEISTNAQFVDWDDFEEMVRLEVVNRLVVSCDGNGTPEDYERLRPPSRWSKLIEFLERARALRDRWAPAMQLMTRTVCDPEPIESRERWRNLLLPRGWTPEFRRWMTLPQSIVNMTGRATRAPSGACAFVADPREFTDHPWHGQIHQLFVDHDGTVVPCCMHPRAGILGNLLEQTFSEILQGSARREFIARLNADRAAMPVCGACDFGPVGNEGPSFRAAMDLPAIQRVEAPEGAPS